MPYPGDLVARGREETPPPDLAAVLDAARAGVRSWHFLGGNPDESLPGVLAALRLTTESLPVVWSSALTLTPAALDVLRGVVDVWVPDLNFGNGTCARRVAGFEGYGAVVRRNLLALAGEPHLAVRQVEMLGHAECCTSDGWAHSNLRLATSGCLAGRTLYLLT